VHRLPDTGYSLPSFWYAYKRYTGRAKVDYQAKEWLKVGTNIAYTYSDSQAPDYQDGDSWGSSANLFYVSNTIAPIYPLYLRISEYCPLA
jgi:hypothetical protein